MQRKRDEVVSTGAVFNVLVGKGKEALQPSQGVHHFTRLDQVNQLVGASEADADMGFMTRLMALCSLPRSNPGNRLQFKRVNGPYTLYMTSNGQAQAPFWQPAAPVVGLGVHRSGADPKPRASPRPLALRVHA